MLARFLWFFISLSAAGQGVSLAGEEAFADTYSGFGLRMPTTSLVVACHGFGCRYQTRINLTQGDRVRLAALLAAGKASASAERRAVAAAVQWFDRRIGPAAGTTRRVARAGPAQSGDKGQLDCLDTSTNNTSLLLLLTHLRLFKHHQAELPASRGLLIDGRGPHATAVISDIKSGQKWAIDNWTRKYGELPEMMPLGEWRQAR